MSDTSTTNVERMAVSMEREIRRITKIDDLKSNEAEMLRDLAKERDAARAEIERLTKERDLSKKLLRSCIQGNNTLREKAQKAMAERDEARASLRHMEGFDCCTCGPCAIHGVTTLADAERDMRQRAADVCDCACMDGIGDKIRAIGDEILALPLKHADREEAK